MASRRGEPTISAAVAPTLTARQLVQSLPEPFRAAVLAELLHDRAAGPAPKPAGESLGYFLPAAPTNQPWPVLTPDEIAQDIRRASEKDRFVPIDEMIVWIKAGMPERSGSPRRDGR